MYDEFINKYIGMLKSEMSTLKLTKREENNILKALLERLKVEILDNEKNQVQGINHEVMESAINMSKRLEEKMNKIKSEEISPRLYKLNQ